jgi:hypothetical protein
MRDGHPPEKGGGNVKDFPASGTRPAVLFEQQSRFIRRQRPDENLWPAGLLLRQQGGRQRQHVSTAPRLLCRRSDRHCRRLSALWQLHAPAVQGMAREPAAKLNVEARMACARIGSATWSASIATLYIINDGDHETRMLFKAGDGPAPTPLQQIDGNPCPQSHCC